MDTEKLCRNCKHMVPDRSGWWFCLFLPLAPFIARDVYKNQYKFGRCGRSHKDYEYLVSGFRDKDSLYYCTTERGVRGDAYCGIAAKFFEPR